MDPRKVAVIAASTSMATLMVFAFLPGMIVASPTVNSGAPPSASWAYGQMETVTVHPMYTASGWEYQGSFLLGFDVILNETNQTAGPNSFGLAVYQAEEVALSLEFCKPNCNAPSEYANLTMRAWETTYDWANFTTNGTVDENGIGVPAIGILNANSSIHANLTESTFAAVRETTSGPVIERSKYLTAALVSDASVSFSPELGLIPLNLLSVSPSSATWTSSSSYTALGSVRSTYYFVFHGPVVLNYTVGPTTTSETFTPSGNVSLTGSFASPSGVPFKSIGTVPAVQLTVVGPFTVREGIILIPQAADLFGVLTQPWSADQASAVAASVAAIDFRPYYGGHLGLIASSRTYTLSSANPANVTGPTENATDDVTDLAGPSASNPVTSTTLQAEPETVSTARSDSSCLVAGSCSSILPSPRYFIWIAAAGVVVAGAAGLIAVVVIADRRRLPTATNPNAPLYPTAGYPPVVGTRRAGPSAPSEPPADEDPLDHLW